MNINNKINEHTVSIRVGTIDLSFLIKEKL